MNTLSIQMYRGFALIIEVDSATHTDRTVIAMPHMLPEGLFLATLLPAANFLEAVELVDYHVDHGQHMQDEEPEPRPHERHRDLLAIEACASATDGDLSKRGA